MLSWEKWLIEWSEREDYDRARNRPIKKYEAESGLVGFLVMVVWLLLGVLGPLTFLGLVVFKWSGPLGLIAYVVSLSWLLMVAHWAALYRAKRLALVLNKME